MANASDLTSAEALQDYVRDFGPELLTQLFTGAPTMELIQGIAGMVGDNPEHVFTNAAYTQDIIRAFSPTFTPVTTDVIGNRTLKAYTHQADIEIIPSQYRGSYLAARARAERPGGEDPYYVPFAQFLMQGRMDKMNQELERAMWAGVRAVTVTPGVTPIIQTIDGFVQKAKDEVTATTITPVTTGALTASNAVAAVESVYTDGLDTPAKSMNVDIFMSVTDRAKFIQDYREKYGKYVTLEAGEQVKLDIGPATFHFLPYVPTNGILICSRENMYMGYNGLTDHENWRFKEQIKSIEGALQFNFGVDFGAVNVGGVRVMAVNDQFVA